MDKTKILMVLGSLSIGGNEIFVMNYYHHIDFNKFEVDFLVYDDDNPVFLNELLEHGSKVTFIKKYKKFSSEFIFQALGTYKFLTNSNYDVIHVHSCSLLGLLRAVIPARLQHCNRIIAHSHNPSQPARSLPDLWARNFLKIILSGCVDYGFACSMIAAEGKYTKKFINSQKFAIIKNAIDVSQFKYNAMYRKEIRKKYNIEDKIVIGSVGRLEQQKNQKFLIHILNLLVKQNCNFVLLLVGEGALRKELEEETRKLNLNSNVIFVGSITDCYKYYSAMDIFVLTSIFEGFGIVNVEAQCSGLYCVISDVVPDIVDCTNNVTFLPLQDGEGIWVNEILNSLNDHHDRLNAYQKCGTYDLNEAVKILENYYLK